MTPVSRINTRLTEDVIRFEPEGKFLERKGRDTKPAKIANELIGMLNAGGGILVYGIANDGTPEDLQQGELLRNSSGSLDAYRKLVHDFIKPPANIDLEEVFLSTGELVFIYHVEPDYEQLFQRDGNEDVYLRVADSNKGPLDRDQVAKLEYNRGKRKFEEELRPDFAIEDLDASLCESYRKAMNYDGDFKSLAYKRNLCVLRDGNMIFKNAAILLFANDPERYIPNASVRYVRHEGTERKSGSEFNVVKDHRFEGPIPKIISEITTFMEASLRDYYYLDLHRGKFIRVPEFPRDAWLEGIVNALYHRSYNIQGNPIMIRHFDDRLEISNSGPLPAHVTVKNIESEKFTRNVRLARTLNDFGYVRELNEGVPRIFRAMREFMLASPEYSDDGTTVTLTLRNKVSNHRETIAAEVVKRIENGWHGFNRSQQEIINVLFEACEATIDELISKMSVSEQTIRSNLKLLENQHIITRVSEKIRDRSAIYRFSDS